MVYFAATWINSFPVKDGASDNLSPRTLITGVRLDANKHCKVPFGTYVQVAEENKPTNTTQTRTQGAIALGPSNNIQGGVRFMSLNTGKQFSSRRQFTVIPITDLIIKRVNDLAESQGQKADVKFFDQQGKEIKNGNQEEPEEPDEETAEELPNVIEDEKIIEEEGENEEIQDEENMVVETVEEEN